MNNNFVKQIDYIAIYPKEMTKKKEIEELLGYKIEIVE